MKQIKILAAILLLASCAPKQEKVDETAHLGVINYKYTISEAAKSDFEKGLLLLHSFEYDDAKEAFIAAEKEDSTEIMAYWGEAMANYKALWGLQDVPAGREVMAKIGATKEERLGKITDELERGFWEGIEILYGDGELKDRNSKYADHMKTLYDKYPHDQEIAAFYALGLMWADYDNQDNLNKSAEVVAGIIKENPTHPGALHYMIHANDDPEYAKVAINAANKYAKVAPDATHALHMPSHIYVALGMWNEAVSSNEASYAASLKRMEQKGLSGKARGYHSMAWLHYGYLQQGRYDKAEELLREMISYNLDSTASLSYTLTMQNEQRIESGKWIEGIEPVDVNYNNLGLSDKSAKHFFNSLMAFDKGDVQGIKTEISTLKDHAAAAELIVTEDGITLCSSGPTRYAPSKTGIIRTNVVINQMEALKAMLENNDLLVEEHLLKAIKLEDESGYDSGPPFIAYPSYEQYGDWLLTKNRLEEALTQFNNSLIKRTNRAKALKGKIQALTMLNRLEEAKEVQQILDVFTNQDLVAKI
ncbi:MAG TPA: hypothetical protein PKL31_03435 [Fulvivirga sp.]|nr:hypothetical protein [Fulvivirga sp.]